jgi:hypothetical protein
MSRLLFAVAAVVTLGLLAACGGDDDETTDGLGSITPIGTKDTTPTPPPANGNGAPAPVEPELDEQLAEITRGDLEATIEPGGAYDLDPETLVLGAGSSASCDNLQFDFSWQITDPYPPEGAGLAWQIQRDSGPVTVASGPAGNQAVGCGLLQATNTGSVPFTVAIKYLIGALP